MHPSDKDLAQRIVAADWYHRAQAWYSGENDKSMCRMCDGEGGYSDYTVSWHSAWCPVRWACEILGRTDALSACNELSEAFAHGRAGKRGGPTLLKKGRKK
jgi:hypothetical protein